MTLAELIAEVYTLTNRPDLVSQTLTAVRSATLFCHQTDYYYKDLFESGLSFTDPTLYIQQIDLETLLPRWRALKYLRKFDNTATPVPGVAGDFFEIILPETVLDSYGVTRENVCYVAGGTLQIRSSAAIGYALMGCYLNPDITQETYTSWIAVKHPYAIVFRAAATVFRMIGKMDENSVYTGMSNEQIAELKLSNIVANGY